MIAGAAARARAAVTPASVPSHPRAPPRPPFWRAKRSDAVHAVHTGGPP